jgi:hypothetical protein
LIDYRLKLLCIGVAFLVLFLGRSQTAWCQETEGSSYIGFLAFPMEIGGIENYRNFYLSGGFTLEMGHDQLGTELNFLSAFTYDELDDRYYSSLPVLVSLNLILYPLSRRSSFSPYIKAGAGCSLAWLELNDMYKTGDYGFWTRNTGTGFKFYLDSGDSYLFFDYSQYWLYGNRKIDDFEVSSRSIGFGIKF